MNNLVLVRVARALEDGFVGGILRDVRQDDAHRFRIRFDFRDGPGRSFIVSLRPDLPWIGRPHGRWPGPAWARQPFAVHCSRELGGSRLTAIRKDPADRVLYFSFADSRGLVAELATHSANLVLLDPERRVLATARNPRRARRRLSVGASYQPPGFPGAWLDPFASDAAAIDALIEAGTAAGATVSEVLLRRVFGLGVDTVDLLLRESGGEPGGPGATLVRRLADIVAGRADPVIEAPSDPLEAAESGTLDRTTCRLLPWAPDDPPPTPLRRLALPDAAGTAGLYHEALERLGLIEDRWSGLRRLIIREMRRLTFAQGKASADLQDFSDPERHRRCGEALLAGLAHARVEGGFALVPDPYDAAAEIAVPVPPGMPLTAAARAYFDKHRRALRGRERARQRVASLADQHAALGAILERFASATSLEALLAMEAQLREHGVPVALEPETRRGRAIRQASRPRLEGVRVLTGRTGATILVGKGSRENDRLTFRLSAPEDLWFHALGRPGAHVVVRDPETGKRTPPELVAEAAAVAAWYSDGQRESRVDVQWTRRKYVRRRRGAAPGAVIVKKFQTVRVRPGLPEREPPREGPGPRQEGR